MNKKTGQIDSRDSAPLILHRWDNNTCKKCGIVRYRYTVKLCMAIVGSKNYYKYDQIWRYILIDGKHVTERPNCIKILGEGYQGNAAVQPCSNSPM